MEIPDKKSCQPRVIEKLRLILIFSWEHMEGTGLLWDSGHTIVCS